MRKKASYIFIGLQKIYYKVHIFELWNVWSSSMLVTCHEIYIEIKHELE